MTAVRFAKDRRASQALLELVETLCGEFPELGPVGSEQAFRKHYGVQLAGLEGRRLALSSRHLIARRANELSLGLLETSSGTPLSELGSAGAKPYPLHRESGHGVPSLPNQLSFAIDDGAPGTDQPLGVIAEQLCERFWCTEPVVEAAHWLQTNAETLDLRGERFVVFGAGAELAPTALLLEAGADVLWVDKRPPPPRLRSPVGSLSYAADGMDLLKDPARVLQTVFEFAGASAVHFGLYAYAPGGAQEWRLCSTMNALLHAFQRSGGEIRGASLLLSPASPGKPTTRDEHQSQIRAASAKGWDRLLGTHGSVFGVRDNAVSAQGISYQAAQYIGKRLASEAWVQDNPKLRLSANIAGISRTRSVQHPVFDIAFSGASSVGVRIFDARFTQFFNGLLTIHDLFGPTKSLEQRLEQQVHGGTFTLPGPLERAIQIAAVVGAMRRPSLLPRLLIRGG